MGPEHCGISRPELEHRTGSNQIVYAGGCRCPRHGPHNRNEVTVIAQEIKRLRPTLPTIVLTEGPVAMDWQLADALVPKESGTETLVKSLEKLLAADRGESAVRISASL
jgi:hypothetical protein